MKVSIPVDTKWLIDRKREWLSYSQFSGYEIVKSDLKSIDQHDRFSQWFIYGDLSPIIESDDFISEHNIVSNLLSSCPASNYQEFLRFLGEYFLWLSNNQYFVWSSKFEGDADVKFFEILNTLILVGSDLSCQVRSGLFKDLYGVGPESTVEFSRSLGNQQWTPKAACDPPGIMLSNINNITQYLFGEPDKHNGAKHTRGMIDYLSKTLPDFDIDLFSLNYVDDEIINERGRKIKTAGQMLFRRFVASMLGYLTDDFDPDRDELLHHDPEAEAVIRKVMESDQMPPEFHKLVDYIHKKKEKCIEPEE